MHGLDQLAPPVVALGDVLHTEELGRRPSRAPDHAAENRALADLAETMARAPRELLQKLVETIRELCQADSAGISILEYDDGREVFRWHAIAGPLGADVGAVLPREASPCGIVLERDAVLLFTRPERYFTPASFVSAPIAEVLLAPFHRGGRPIGTVWAVAHAEGREFDAEDARLLESLSRFTGAAYQTIGALDAAETARFELERRVAERTSELSRMNEALRANEARLEAELSAVRRLQGLGARLVDCADLPAALEEILDGMLALLGADLGNVQLLDPRRHVLVLTASRGFRQDFLDRFREVDARDDTACGRALRSGETVVIEDVETDREYEPFRGIAAAAGYRAVLSAPLHSRGGGLLGVMSAHFRRPHRPSGRDRRMLELYSRIVTGLIERLRSEEALRASEERFRLLVENVRDDAILFLDTEGRVSDWNEGIERLLGYRAEEVIGRPCERFFIPEDVRLGLPGRIRREAADLGRADGEHWMVRADGSRFWAGGAITALRDPAGELRGYVRIFRDLTERRATEAALREAQERLQLALSAAHMGIWTWDAGADTLTHDANLNRLLGLEATATSQPLEEFLDLIHPDDRAVVAFSLRACARRGRPVHLEFRVIRPDGSIRWLRYQGSCSRGREGRSTQVAGASVDITDLMETEEALRRARKQLEQRVAWRVGHLAEEHASRSLGAVRRAIRVALRVAGAAARLAEAADTATQVQAAARMAATTTRAAERALKMVLAFETARSRVPNDEWVEAIWTEVRRAMLAGEEQQRRRIARELHDQLGQCCASLIMGMTALEARLPEGSELAGQLARLVEIAREVDDDLHRIALELRPTALDDFGLLATLLSYVEDWRERTGIAVDFQSSGLEDLRLPAEVETAAFRIVQEALTNVQKHARARRVGLILGVRGGDLVVIVEDDGRGFDLEAAASAGRLGIRGMRERAALVGGELEVESSPEAGTMVYVRIPLGSAAGGSIDA